MPFSDIKIKSGGLFLEIENSRPVLLRLLQDDPLQFVIHGFGKTQAECSGENCVHCNQIGGDGKPTDFSKRRRRFKLNAYSHDANKVMIWEFGPQILEQLQNCEKSLVLQEALILDVDLIVSSSGESKDKSYSVQPALKSKTVPAGLALHSLDLPF